MKVLPEGISICSVELTREPVPIEASTGLWLPRCHVATLLRCCLCKVFSATIEPEIHWEEKQQQSQHMEMAKLPQAGNAQPCPAPCPGALILRKSEG